MNRRWLIPAVALALILGALGWLFSVRLGGGSVYPEYSSHRADALGTRALHDALQEMPGFTVEREHRPLDRLGGQPRVIFIPGVRHRAWRWLPADQLAALQAAMQKGARVVIAFRPERAFDGTGQIEREIDAAEKKAEEDRAKGRKSDDVTEPSGDEAKKRTPRARGAGTPARVSVQQAFGANVRARATFPEDAPAELATGVMVELPARLGWHGDVHFEFEENSGWQALYLRGGRVVLAEKRIGQGALVLLADAFPLSNEGVHRARVPSLLAWLIGEHRRATFVESHLGVVEEKTIGTLARRYGLGGALAMAALLGALYAWRRLVAFYPLRDEVERDGVVTLGHEPTAGLVALLRRSLSRRKVLAACVAEWRKQAASGGSAAARERLEAAWREGGAETLPAETYNRLVAALKRR